MDGLRTASGSKFWSFAHCIVDFLSSKTTALIIDDCPSIATTATAGSRLVGQPRLNFSASCLRSFSMHLASASDRQTGRQTDRRMKKRTSVVLFAKFCLLRRSLRLRNAMSHSVANRREFYRTTYEFNGCPASRWQQMISSRLHANSPDSKVNWLTGRIVKELSPTHLLSQCL